jgi:hypothetical protein
VAERAKRRFTAAKLSVSVAVAAALAGLIGRDKSPESIAYQLVGAQPHMAPGSITSADVKDGSLLYKDMKRGQIYSLKMTDNLFAKMKTVNRTFLKINQANDVFLQKADAANTYLKLDDAHRTYLKIEDANNRFVMGDGSVFTGFGTSSQGILIGLLKLPGLADVNGDGRTIQITNTSGSPLEISMPGSAQTIEPGGMFEVAVGGQGGSSITIQMLVPAVQKVATLTVSSIVTGGGTDLAAQALVGAP